MINKQDVLNLIKDMKSRISNDLYSEADETVLDILLNKIEGMEETDEWIPVEKQLPEDKTAVLATVRHERWICDYERDEDEWTVHPEYHEVCSIYRDGDKYKKMDDSDFDNITCIPVEEQEQNLAYPIEVVTAWMPLPEPFREVKQ